MMQEKMKKRRGKYICFEGGDGCGKSTLSEAVYEELGQDEAVRARFPSDGVVGSLIRQGLVGKVSMESKPFLYLFAADGLQQQLWIQDQLEEQERHIICDRHPTMSGRAFQPDHHPQVHIEAVYAAAKADGLMDPDILFVIDLPVDETFRRMKDRGILDVAFEKLDKDHIYRIKCRYLELAKRFDGVVLDGTLSITDLVDQVYVEADLP